MKKWLKLGSACFLVFGLAACIERPENEMVQETERVDPASGIDVTTQSEGIFKGFANGSQDALTIEIDGKEKSYELAEDATGDFNVLQEGDRISFSTKKVGGKERIETIMRK
ncbi:hypothetical protein SAMN04487975_108104 [Planococcus glaciei]|uniref:hypothetical protein n=1 Tax=Planococcus glaciei TaxID=459472 RepID=UPI00088BB095|nr:hypothetical protein [Planococcus glaciei]SDH82519.1 hypothetical protein SAMN04487975_108104 [Planococcus glaciei]